MSNERMMPVNGFDLGSKRVCALVGNFTESGFDIVYRDLKTESFCLDNIDLDFCDRTIVKMQKPKGGRYVR